MRLSRKENVLGEKATKMLAFMTELEVPVNSETGMLYKIHDGALAE